MIPITRGSASAHRMMHLQAARGHSVKGSIFIASNPYQHNYVPRLEYYTKGSLLRIPECAKSRNSKTLTSKKLGSIDPVLLSPDQVSTSIVIGCKTLVLAHYSRQSFQVVSTSAPLH